MVENKYRERIAEYLGHMQRDPFTFGMGTPGSFPGLEIIPKQLQVREMVFHDFGLLHGIIHVPRRRYQHRKTYQPYVRGYLESREVPASQFTNGLTVERFANLFGIPNITLTRITDEVWMQTVEAFNSLPWVEKAMRKSPSPNPYAGWQAFYAIAEIPATEAGFQNFKLAQRSLVSINETEILTRSYLRKSAPNQRG